MSAVGGECVRSVMAPRLSRGAAGAKQDGFALAAVLWVLAIAAMVGLALAVAVRYEMRAAAAAEEGLRAELLAEAGLAFADYLAGRRLGAAGEDLAGLPVTAAIPRFHYRIETPDGEIDLYIEGEDGKISLSTAPRALLEAFFTLWTGTPAQGARIAAAVENWRTAIAEPDAAADDRGYAPRGGPLGAADVLLLAGLNREDVHPRVLLQDGRVAMRPGLMAFVTTDPAGPGVNPNLAPRLVLESLPGMTESAAAAIVEARRRSYFSTAEELGAAAGPMPLSARDHFKYGASAARAILAVGRTAAGARRSIRRIERSGMIFDPLQQAVVPGLTPNRIERNAFPEFVDHPR